MLGRFGHISLAAGALVAIVPAVARPAPQTPTEIVVVGTVHTARCCATSGDSRQNSRESGWLCSAGTSTGTPMAA